VQPAWTPNIRSECVVADTLHCRRCGYDVRGLRADGKCPECGTDLWLTILHVTDPGSSTLPKLKNPRTVGFSLAWLMSCILIATLALAARFAMENVVTYLGPQPQQPWIQAVTHAPGMWVFSGIMGIISLLGVTRLARPRADEPSRLVRHALRWLTAGILGWSLIQIGLAAMVWAEQTTMVRGYHLLAIVGDLGAMIGFLGLRGTYQAIGFRSSEFRTARGRQGAGSMVVALWIDIAGRCLLIGQLTAESTHPPTYDDPILGSVVVTVSNLMLLIGVGYLAANAWWVRSVLRKPPPTIDEVLIRDPVEFDPQAAPG
jgi:hypothetical protein